MMTGNDNGINFHYNRLTFDYSSVTLLDSGSCAYGRQTNQLLGHRTMRASSRSIWDIEDAVRLGKSTKGKVRY